VCLDFCNTVGGSRGGLPREFLQSYADFVSWSQQAGLISEALAQELLRKASRRSDEALKVLERAKALREAVYRVFMDRAQDKMPRRADLAVLNMELARLLPRLQVVSKDACCDWAWTQAEELDFALGPIAQSAADLITSHQKPQLRQCEGDNCGWLFLDLSKNHSRRWCDMRDCGNRAKVRRHRSKTAR
jgi:predicted RNA-binding Zn ribbon-like protein